LPQYAPDYGFTRYFLIYACQTGGTYPMVVLSVMIFEYTTYQDTLQVFFVTFSVPGSGSVLCADLHHGPPPMI